MNFARQYYPVIYIPSALLLIPALAMWLDAGGWDWTAADFIIAWSAISVTVLGWQVLSRATSDRNYRLAVALGLAGVFMVFWINGAVGLMGSEDHPANRMFAAIFVIGVTGVILSRLKPGGMAITAVTLAATQIMIPVAARILWPSDFGPGIPAIFGFNLILVLLFFASALLFSHADRQKKGPD